MNPAQLFRRCCLISLTLLLGCVSVFAQSPIDPGKLPAHTLFYALWRGTPSAQIQQNNSLFALWNDPQFAVARASFVNSVSNQAKDEKTKPAVSREQLDQYVTLLDNPFLIGYLRRPESAAPAKSTQKKSATPDWNGLFFIYDRSGKEELLSKAVLQMRTADQDIPKISELTVAGVSALKLERKSGITYWAEFSKYAVSANELSVFEQILNVANGNSSASTLAQLSAYQEAKPMLNGGLLEFFAAIPKADQIAANASGPLAAQLGLVLSALKLESIHSVAGRVSLEGAKTRLTGAILGDTSPGSFFDIWPEGQSHPVSLGYLQPDTISYGESEFNLPGIYNMLKRAFAPSSVASQSPTPLEEMAEARLGMPLPDALGLLTGEIAWIESSPTLDDSQKLFLVGIRNKPEALKLTRTIMSDQISSERTEGDTTYLKISLHGGQSAAGVTQWNFYHLAMTPNLLFGSSKREMLQKVVAQTPAAPDPGQFQDLLAARAQFPEKLNGFSYMDLQKLDWAGMRAKFVAEANKAAQTSKNKSSSQPNKNLLDWLAQVDPAVLHQYLHSMIGASWKDSSGVHFEEWLD
jgi:hypothetical protein